jgi:hypothetical protein
MFGVSCHCCTRQDYLAAKLIGRDIPVERLCLCRLVARKFHAGSVGNRYDVAVAMPD